MPDLRGGLPVSFTGRNVGPQYRPQIDLFLLYVDGAKVQHAISSGKRHSASSLMPS